MNDGIRNAQIIDTFLGFVDHGRFTAIISAKSGSSVQDFGMHTLEYEAYGIVYLERLLEAVGVSCWKDLKGKHVRVQSRDGLLVAIGHIIDDRWFNPRRDLAKEPTDERHDDAG